MLILETLTRKAQNPALVFGNQTLTYEELDHWSSSLAVDLGSVRGQPTGLLAPPSFEYFAGMIAIWKAGGIVVPLQPAHPLEELRYITQDAGLSRILTHPSCQTIDLPARQHLIERKLRPHTSPSPSPNSSALMIYTSGTTGRPKGVVSTHANLDAQISSLLKAWEWTEADRTLNVLPLHHVHGVVVLSGCALAAGARIEIADKFAPELVWERVASGAINVFMAVPTIYARLVEHWESQPPAIQKNWSAGASRLRLTVSGSAALPVPLFEKWKRISGQPLLERYGMTEIGMALSNPFRSERRPGYVGKPLPGVEVRLAAEDGRHVDVPNTPGELYVRGPTVFKEYWGQPDATKTAFTDEGWFETGDIAERDSAGNYRILGRNSQDIIKTGGYKVSALEIENCLLEHAQVREVAVVGVPDEVWGERVAAAVVLRGSVTEEELAGFAKSKLARYKVPTRWLFVSELPRNAMGKIPKPKVRGLFEP